MDPVARASTTFRMGSVPEKYHRSRLRKNSLSTHAKVRRLRSLDKGEAPQGCMAPFPSITRLQYVRSLFLVSRKTEHYWARTVGSLHHFAILATILLRTDIVLRTLRTLRSICKVAPRLAKLNLRLLLIRITQEQLYLISYGAHFDHCSLLIRCVSCAQPVSLVG